MVSTNEQLRIVQNQLLECRKQEVKNDMKIDELTERADFYEKLHNKKQEKLYEAENKYLALKLEFEQEQENLNRHKQECEALKQELQQLKHQFYKMSVQHITSVQLFAIILKRLRQKIAGM